MTTKKMATIDTFDTLAFADGSIWSEHKGSMMMQVVHGVATQVPYAVDMDLSLEMDMDAPVEGLSFPPMYEVRASTMDVASLPSLEGEWLFPDEEGPGGPYEELMRLFDMVDAYQVKQAICPHPVSILAEHIAVSYETFACFVEESDGHSEEYFKLVELIEMYRGSFFTRMCAFTEPELDIIQLGDFMALRSYAANRPVTREETHGKFNVSSLMEEMEAVTKYHRTGGVSRGMDPKHLEVALRPWDQETARMRARDAPDDPKTVVPGLRISQTRLDKMIEVSCVGRFVMFIRRGWNYTVNVLHSLVVFIYEHNRLLMHNILLRALHGQEGDTAIGALGEKEFVTELLEFMGDAQKMVPFLGKMLKVSKLHGRSDRFHVLYRAKRLSSEEPDRFMNALVYRTPLLSQGESSPLKDAADLFVVNRFKALVTELMDYFVQNRYVTPSNLDVFPKKFSEFTLDNLYLTGLSRDPLSGKCSVPMNHVVQEILEEELAL